MNHLLLAARDSMGTKPHQAVIQLFVIGGYGAALHYLPVYWHSYYEKLGYVKGLCPNAESYYEEVMSLPLYYQLTDADAEDVSSPAQSSG